MDAAKLIAGSQELSTKIARLCHKQVTVAQEHLGARLWKACADCATGLAKNPISPAEAWSRWLEYADGLPMGTRCGNVDPGVMLYLLDELKMDARAIDKLDCQQSGLLGTSSISGDMRTLEASDAPEAKFAIDVFIYQIGRELGSLAAALGGLDAIVFTAGIGENSRSLRERVCRDAAWLGVEFDAAANDRNGPRISAATSRVSAWAMPTDEELMIARHTRRLLDRA